LVPLEARQSFAETRQAVPTGLQGFGGQVAVRIQAAALADSLFDVFGANKFLILHDSDFKAETVGAEVYRGKAKF
jgi:hypothetical protein